MGEITLRFGKVSVFRSRFPSLDRIKNALDEHGIVGSEGERNGAQRTTIDEGYLFGLYFKEVEEQDFRFNSDNEVVPVEFGSARSLQFFLLENGTYAYESKRGVSDNDLIPYIFEVLDEDYEYEHGRYEEFSLDTMRAFYKSHEEVRKLKVNEIGEKDPNPHWGRDEITDLTQDTGEDTDNTTFSVGRKYNNLKNADLIHEGFARLSNLVHIRARNQDDDIEELRESGRLGTTYSEKLDEEEQREKVRNAAVEALQLISAVDDLEHSESEEHSEN
jgi:hypothetical protein